MGLLSAILIYSFSSIVYLLTLVHRLPWFIAEWAKIYEFFSTKRFDSPSKEPPDRFPIGPTIPTIFLVWSFSAIFLPHSFQGRSYSLIWPLFVMAIGWLYIHRREVKYFPKRDNWAIILTFDIHLASALYLIMVNTMVKSSPYGPVNRYNYPGTFTGAYLIGESTILIFSLVVMATILYFLPEIFEWVLSRHSIEPPNKFDPLSGLGRKQLNKIFLTFLSIMGGLSLLLSLLLHDGLFGLLIWYLAIGAFIVTIIFWKLDPEYFDPSYEIPERKGNLIAGIVILYFAGLLIISIVTWGLP